MDDRRFDQTSGNSLGRSLLQIVRLAVLMIVGAFVGQILFVPTIGDGHREVDSLLPATLSGAIGGLIVEIIIRARGPKQKIDFRFGIRDLLLIVAIVATAFWVIAMFRNAGNPTH